MRTALVCAALTLLCWSASAQVPASVPAAPGRPTGVAPGAVPVDADVSFPPGKPEILGRDQWLTAQNSCKHLSKVDVSEEDIDDDTQPRTRIAVHHTEGLVSDEEKAMDAQASAERVKEILCAIREYHMGVVTSKTVVVRRRHGRRSRRRITHRTGHDWSDIGYHFVIDWRGRIWEGRHLEKVGANVRSNNDGLIGVALLGDFMTQKPTPEQLRSLKQLLGWLMATYKIPPEAIRGHGDIVETDCPGRYMEYRGEESRPYDASTASPLSRVRHELRALWAMIPHTAEDEEGFASLPKAAELKLPETARSLAQPVSFDGGGR